MDHSCICFLVPIADIPVNTQMVMTYPNLDKFLEYHLNRIVLIMTMKCHNHRLQTNTGHFEDKTQNTYSQTTIKVKQPILSSSAI